MKSLLATAAVAVLALAGPPAAQATTPIRASAAADQANQLQAAAMPPWGQDDGSSSDYPVPMPSDRSGAALNTQYRDGITAVVPPGAAAPPGFAPMTR